jgi:hypothetical protein
MKNFDLTFKGGFNFGIDTIGMFDMRGKMPRLSKKSDEFYRGFWAYRAAYFDAVRENAKTGEKLKFPLRMQ